MFFEGSEKKVEIIVSSDKVSLLRDYDDSFWEIVVAQCDAKILSSIRNAHVKAYLLSESSLFVWDNRVLMLTCGDTFLVKSVLYLLENIAPNLVQQVIYQRKNEYCSHLQASHVKDDAKLLQQFHSGKLLRFGELDSHHSYLYHLDNNYSGAEDDKTYEVLLYNIDKSISSMLTQQCISKEAIRSVLKLDKIIPDFVIDDFAFKPFGYSLNAISGADYFTIHLTPQPHNSYVSFESNLNLLDYIPIILESFKPASFDVVTYNEFDFRKRICSVVPLDYHANELVEEELSCSYLVNFASYNQKKSEYTQPIVIHLEGESHEF